MRSRELGQPFAGFHFATLRGTTLLHEKTGPYAPPGRAPVVLHRADIIDQLQRRIPRERLHFGHRLERIAGKTLHFDDGTTQTCELLIGADGIHSRVRQALLTDRPPRASGQIGLWGISPGTLDLPNARCFNELWGNGVRMGFSYVGQAGVYWFTVVRTPPPKDPDARLAFILEHARGFPEGVLNVVRRSGHIHATKLWDVPPPTRWHTDWVCCIGDAVHACTPNLGQGACQALEDAACLSELWQSVPDPETRFARYQRQRRVRATAVVYLARWLGMMGQIRGPLRWARNAVVWATPAWVLRPALRWIMVR